MSLSAQVSALFCATPTGFCVQMPSQFLTGCYSFPICGANQVMNIFSIIGLTAVPITCFMHGCTSWFMNFPFLSMFVFPCDIGVSYGSNCIIIPFNMIGMIYTGIMGIPNFALQGCYNTCIESLCGFGFLFFASQTGGTCTTAQGLISSITQMPTLLCGSCMGETTGLTQQSMAMPVQAGNIGIGCMNQGIGIWNSIAVCFNSISSTTMGLLNALTQLTGFEFFCGI
jgi:hypothetical protein